MMKNKTHVGDHARADEKGLVLLGEGAEVLGGALE